MSVFRGSSLHFVGASKLAESVKDLHNVWIPALDLDIRSLLNESEEEGVKPSLPIINWNEENGDELPF